MTSTGPLPADTAFQAAFRTRFDAVICMYHDQALIPIKTLGFHDGVNTTLGLPFIRTSPDHGTALRLAGTGRASPRSLIAALRLAAAMARAVAVSENEAADRLPPLARRHRPATASAPERASARISCSTST